MHKNNSKIFFLKVCFFFLPFIMALCIELALPLDFFTQRGWEALSIKKLSCVLPGYFYPHTHLFTHEKEDLAEIPRVKPRADAVWVIDRFGYRTRNTGLRRPEVVIVGDSSIVGAGLSQEDTIGEVLEKKLGKSVYPLASASMSINVFLNSQRFKENPPDTVILAVTERSLCSMPLPEEKRKSAWYAAMDKVRQDWCYNNILCVKFCIALDRLLASNMYHYIRARLFPAKPIGISYGGPVYFYKGESANMAVAQDEVQRIVRVLEAYKSVLRARGIRFIFLPVPNKENILYRYLPSGRKPVFLKTLIENARLEGVEAIDTQSLFENSYEVKGMSLYKNRESHWNAAAVRIAADALCEALGKNNN